MVHFKENEAIIDPNKPSTSGKRKKTTTRKKDVKKKKTENDEVEENEEQPTTSKTKAVRKSWSFIWKQLLDERNVSEEKQKAIKIDFISEKLSTEIVEKYMQDQTRNGCIIVKLPFKGLTNLKQIIKAVRCSDDIYKPDGNYKFTKTCNNDDCVQINHWDVSLKYENAARRHRVSKKTIKEYEDVPEEETFELVQYLMRGIDQQIQGKVRERTTAIATELMVDFQMDAAQLVEMLSRNECNHVEGFVPIICMCPSHYTLFDEGRIQIDPAPIIPANPYPTELVINAVSHDFIDLEPVDSSNLQSSELRTPEIITVFHDDANASSVFNEAEYGDDVAEESDEQIGKYIEQECEIIDQQFAEIDENGFITIDYDQYQRCLSNWSCTHATNPPHNVSYLGTVHDHWLPESEENIIAAQTNKRDPAPIVINFSKNKKNQETALQSLEPFMNNHYVVVGKIQTWIEEEMIDENTLSEILEKPEFKVVKTLLEDLKVI
uniref:Uncharacterized protein n=1 Tax=Panagrolaimus davidi TaxID=227884 RepID=A0A914R1M8_9BILA